MSYIIIVEHMHPINFIKAYNNGDRTIEFNADDFAIMCSCNRLDIVQWMCSFDDKLDNDDYLQGFLSSCTYGYLKIAQWLWINILNEDIGERIYDVFIDVCANGQLDIAKWLYDISKLDIHNYNDNAFIKSCKYGRLDVAKWLYDLDQEHFQNNNLVINSAIRWSCEKGHYDTAQWICDTFHDYELLDTGYGIDYKEVKINRKLHDAIKNDQLEILFNDAKTINIGVTNDTTNPKEIICGLCLDDQDTINKWIELECKHLLCVDCYSYHDRCTFGCKCNYKNIVLFKID